MESLPQGRKCSYSSSFVRLDPEAIPAYAVPQKTALCHRQACLFKSIRHPTHHTAVEKRLKLDNMVHEKPVGVRVPFHQILLQGRVVGVRWPLLCSIAPRISIT